jgi:hypothetical protein
MRDKIESDSEQDRKRKDQHQREDRIDSSLTSSRVDTGRRCHAERSRNTDTKHGEPHRVAIEEDRRARRSAAELMIESTSIIPTMIDFGKGQEEAEGPTQRSPQREWGTLA